MTSLRILFEDSSIIAISKPAGIPSHTLSDPEQITVESLLKKERPELGELSILHRLDRGTTGILLFAKTKIVFDQIRLLFQQKKITKLYKAWSKIRAGKLPPEFKTLPFTIQYPLAHHPKNKKKMVVILPHQKQSFRGKPLPAKTIILEIRQFPAITEFKVQIITGVTHQIRVHLNAFGFPLVGDGLYLPKEYTTDCLTETKQEPELGLHASEISFDLDQVHYHIVDNTRKTPTSTP